MSIDESFNLLLMLVRKRQDAENTRSASTEVGGIVIKELYKSVKTFVFSPPEANNSNSFANVS